MDGKRPTFGDSLRDFGTRSWFRYRVRNKGIFSSYDVDQVVPNDFSLFDAINNNGSSR